MAARQLGIVSDPIADMLTRIRNANGARHPEVRVPSSRLKLEMARVLKAEGYIAGYDVEESPGGAGETLKVTAPVVLSMLNLASSTPPPNE